MAKAFVPKVDNPVGNLDGTFSIDMSPIYSGPDVPGGTDTSIVSVLLDGSDTVADIKNKMSSAVTNEAIRLGYSLSSVDIIIPNFQKGN